MSTEEDGCRKGGKLYLAEEALSHLLALRVAAANVPRQKQLGVIVKVTNLAWEQSAEVAHFDTLVMSVTACDRARGLLTPPSQRDPIMQLSKGQCLTQLVELQKESSNQTGAVQYRTRVSKCHSKR